MTNSNLDLEYVDGEELFYVALTWLVMENIVKQLKLKGIEEHPKVTPTAASLDVVNQTQSKEKQV